MANNNVVRTLILSSALWLSSCGTATVPAASESAPDTARDEHAAPRPPDAADAHAALRQILPTREYDGVPLDQVLADLTAAAGVPIDVRWDVIQQAGVDPKTPVVARLRNARLEKALRIVTDGVGADDRKLAAVVPESTGRITVTTWAAAYPPQTQQFDIVRIMGGHDMQRQPEETWAEMQNQVMQLVSESVDPDSWVENGGKIGRIGCQRGTLTVTQSPQNMRQVTALLRELAQSRGLPDPVLPQRAATSGPSTLPATRPAE